MQKHKIFKKITSILLVLVCVFSSLYVYPTYKTEAASLSSLEDKYSDLEKQLEQLKKDMKNTQNKKNQQLQYKKQLDTEISLVEQQIENLNTQISALNAQLQKNETLLNNKEDEISENDELFKARLRAMYMMGDTSVWEVIFGSKSFAEFLTNAEYMKRIATADNELMNKLNADKQDILKAKEEVETAKIKIEANKKTMDYKKSSLYSKYQESQNLINSLAKDEKKFQQEQIKINEEMEKIDQEIRDWLAQNGSDGSFNGKNFLWPVPNYSTITSRFGWRTLYGKKNWHTGVDISGYQILGKNIVASQAGTVIKAVTTYTPKKGYGKYVMIDHGGGYTTMYAHCTSLSVKVGQYVKRGQVIAQVGSTGNSTGPHLHFGIYINGKEVDPLPYIT